MDTVHFCISLRLNFFDMFNFHDACKITVLPLATTNVRPLNPSKKNNAITIMKVKGRNTLKVLFSV